MGTLGSPCVLFPMGDASVPTPLRPSPAPTNVTICSKKPTVERESVPLHIAEGIVHDS